MSKQHPAATRVHGREQDLNDALLEISNLVGSVLRLDALLSRVCEISAAALRTDTCSLYLREDALDRDEPGCQKLVLRATQGLPAALVNKGSFLFGQGIPGWAAAKNETTTVRDSRKDPRYAALDDGPEENFVAYLCVPLRVQHEVVGVLSMRRREPTDWTEQDVTFAEIIGKQVAIVIEKARLYVDKIDAERLAAVAISLSETAHGIKNILQGMTGGRFILEVGLAASDLERVEKGWGLMSRSVARIERLVKNMLSYSSTSDLILEPGDLNELVGQLAADVAETAEMRKIAITLDLHDNLPHVAMEEHALHDAVLNLVTNAIDAIPEFREDGHVRISTKLDKAKHVAVVTVTDNGSGIPADAQAKMFTLFYTTKGSGGTGIGLSVTKKIIEQHGGRIGFTSTEGGGTTFRVELPCCPE
jgi:two-component system NtrC family sensor kinase